MYQTMRSTVGMKIDHVRTDGNKLDNSVDEHIRSIVAALQLHGITTFASCEGHLDHGCSYPWVDIGTWVDDPELEVSTVEANHRHCQRLQDLLDEYYQHHPEIGREHRLILDSGGTMGDARLQAAQTDRTEKSGTTAKSLAEFQSDMEAFAAYLLSVVK
jgi:hypothetical protein